MSYVERIYTICLLAVRNWLRGGDGVGCVSLEQVLMVCCLLCCNVGYSYPWSVSVYNVGCYVESVTVYGFNSEYGNPFPAGGSMQSINPGQAAMWVFVNPMAAGGSASVSAPGGAVEVSPGAWTVGQPCVSGGVTNGVPSSAVNGCGLLVYNAPFALSSQGFASYSIQNVGSGWALGVVGVVCGGGACLTNVFALPPGAVTNVVGAFLLSSNSVCDVSAQSWVYNADGSLASEGSPDAWVVSGSSVVSSVLVLPSLRVINARVRGVGGVTNSRVWKVYRNQ